MKRIILLYMLLFTGLVTSFKAYCQKPVMPNPAAWYCKVMGYKYLIEKDAGGNQKSVCILPDSSKVDAWDFFRGKIGKQYSYCAKKGYNIVTKTLEKDGYKSECAVCTKEIEKSGIMHDSSLDNVPLLDLMKRDGLFLCDTTDKSSPFSSPKKRSIKQTNPELKSVLTLPQSFDWRNNNGHAYIGPVRDQSTCGSCYAFSITACAEGIYNVASGLYDNSVAKFSESFVMWCLGSTLSSYGCCGGWPDEDANSIVSNGICDSASFPYTMTNPGTCSYWNSPHAHFSSYSVITNSDINAIKTVIYSYGIVSAFVDATNFGDYEGGIFTESGGIGSPHAVAIVGWGHDPTYGDYWIIRNSWGQSWGEDGYMRILVTSHSISTLITYFVPTPISNYEGSPLNATGAYHINSNLNLEGQNAVTLNPGFSAVANGTSQLSIFSIAYNPKENTTIPTKSCSGEGFPQWASSKNITNDLLDDINSDVLIYPNPGTDKLFIKGPPIAHVNIIDLYGKECILIEKVNENIIDISTLSRGTYILIIQTSHKTYRQLFIKN